MTTTVFPIGTSFITRGKNPRLCTVVDILKTYNYEGDHVQTCYIVTYELAGRVRYDYNVRAATIAMGKPQRPL
jgi:hypothetical protein